MKAIVDIVIFLTFFKITSSSMISSCQVKMATSSMAIFKPDDKLIFNAGVINKSFEESSQDKYIVPEHVEMEYFYIFEDKQANAHTHDHIRATVFSANESLLNVNSTVSNENSQFQDSYDMTAIKVDYACNETANEKINVSMLVVSDNCDPFTIHWIKQCSPVKMFPRVSIGVTGACNQIMKEGNFTQEIKVANDDSKFLIGKDTFTMDLCITAKDNSIILNEPKVNYNQDSVAVLVKGGLSKGGELTQVPQTLQLAFACTPLRTSTTDIQVQLPFDDKTNINLFFSKECDPVQIEQVQEYFTILYFVYWILITLLIVFVVIVLLYFLKTQDMSLIELFNKSVYQFGNFLDWAKEKCVHLYHRKILKGTNKESTQGDRLFEDESLVIVKENKSDLTSSAYGAI